MDNQWFNPNLQLGIIFGLFILVAVSIGAIFAWIKLRLNAIEKMLEGPVVPFWRHTLAEMSAIMMHNHDWAKEQDEAMTEVNKSPEVLNDPVKYEQLKTLIHERTLSTSPDLREDENIVASIYLLALPFARKEGKSLIALGDIKRVGTQAPAEQTATEKADASAAPAEQTATEKADA